MARARPCLGCGAMLDGNGNCATKDCAYNPQADMQEHDADLKVGDEIEHTGGEIDSDLTDEEWDELMDDSEPFDPEAHADTDELNGLDDSPKHSKDDEAAEDSDKMDLSQEDLPEQNEAPKENAKGDLKDREPDDLTDEQKQQLNDQLQEFMQQLSEQEDEREDYARAEDLGDHPDDDDPNLPDRPRGCEGNCQPKDDPSELDEPCPHCTAKGFRDQMEGEQKERDADELKQEFDNFMNDWNKQAEQDDNEGGQHEGEGGDTPDYDKEIKDESDDESDLSRFEEVQNEKLDPDDKPEQKQGEENPDLPPRPQGCDGNCQPGDDPEGEACPHCTAKQFKLSLEEEGEDPEALKEQSPEDFEKALDEFRQKWEKEADKKRKDVPEGEQKPEEVDEDPPEDELKDGEPKDEKKSDDEDDKDEEKPEFKRMAKDMTVTQEKRFDNLVERLEKKVEQTFGNTAEDTYTMAKQTGQFEGEEVSQSIQISSRGVTYWVTIAAAKEM